MWGGSVIRTLGLIELNSIAKGFEVADTMLKAAEVKLLRANSICPGKYLIMISGDVGSVKAAVEAGVEVGGTSIVDKMLLPSLHEQIIPAITGTSEINFGASLGALEFFSISSAVVAADAAAKAANVSIIEIRLGFAIGGKAFVTLTGDVSAVNSAIEAGAEVGKESGMLVNKTVIPRPSPELMDKLI